MMLPPVKRKSKRISDLASKRQARDPPEDEEASLLQLHHSCTQSLVNADYDAAIDFSIQASEKLDFVKATILDTRAAAYAMKSKFAEAMETVEKMIEYAPTSAIGYLRGGDTLALQGKHRRAIRMYNQGLEKVPIDDEEYMSLENRKTASRAQLRKRVDFLTLLPADVTQLIIDKLDIADDMEQEYTEVSKGWRQILIDCPLAWDDIQSMHCGLFRFLPVIGKHVRKFGSSCFDSNDSQVIIKAIVSGQLSNIRSLHLEECKIGRHQLSVILSRLGNTLTDFTVVFAEYDHAPPLETILLACPKLEALCYHINEGDICFSEVSTPVMTKYSIKSLELEVRSMKNKVPNEALDAIFRRCPHLRTVKVKPCTSSALQLINNHCPQLKTLGFNGATPSKSSTITDGRTGIQFLAIHGVRNLEPENVIQLLEKSQSTLISAVLALEDKSPNILERWNGLTRFKGETLTNFSYAFGRSDMHKVVAAMVRNCKALESVRLQSLQGHDGNAMGKSLMTLPKLKYLWLNDIRNVSVAGLDLLFAAQAAMERNASLRIVSFVKCNKIPDTVLETLASIKTVETVFLDETKDLLTSTLSTFICQLISHSTLKKLVLGGMDVVTDAVLCDVAKISSLTELHLNELSQISENGVELSVSQMKGLKSIQIFNCRQIDVVIAYVIQRRVSSRKKSIQK